MLSLVLSHVEDKAEQLIRHFHLNPASRYPQILLDAAAGLTDFRLWLLALGALLNALFRFTEAYCLWYHKRWAKWLGVVSGSSPVPIETDELSEEIRWPKLLVLVANLVIIVYVGCGLV